MLRAEQRRQVKYYQWNKILWYWFKIFLFTAGNYNLLINLKHNKKLSSINEKQVFWTLLVGKDVDFKTKIKS